MNPLLSRLRRVRLGTIAVPTAFVVALGGIVVATDSLSARLQPSLASVSVLVVEPDSALPDSDPTETLVGDDGSTVVPVSSTRQKSVVVVIPDDAQPLVIDPADVDAFSSTSTTSTASVGPSGSGGDEPNDSPGPFVPPGVFDADAGIFVDDPDGNLADLTAAASSASAAAGASGIDPTTDARAGTAIDDDADVAAGAQAYAGARTGGDAAAIAAAVAVAADNHVLVGEPEVEVEGEIEVENADAFIELYADVSVIVFSDDVTGFADGGSIVIETAVLIVRNNEAIVVYADGRTGRVGGDTTVGNIVSYQEEFSIESEASILGDAGALPKAVAERLLERLRTDSTATTTTTTTLPPADEPTAPRAWSDIDEVLDEFVDEMVEAVHDPDPQDDVTFTDDGDDPGDISISQDGGVEDADETETEAEAEAEAEASAAKSGSAAAAAAATSSAASADANAAADGEATTRTEVDGAVSEETERDAAGGPDDGVSPETDTSSAASTEAEASDGDDVETSASEDDTIDLDDDLDAADPTPTTAAPVVTTPPATAPAADETTSPTTTTTTTTAPSTTAPSTTTPTNP